MQHFQSNLFQTGPPSAPTFARNEVNDSSIVITWSRPRDNGGRSDVTYRYRVFTQSLSVKMKDRSAFDL